MARKSSISSGGKSKAGGKRPGLLRRALRRLPWRKLGRAGALIAIWGFIIGVAILAWCAVGLPDVRKGAVFERRPAVIILARDGQEIARFGEISGKPVTLKDLPPDLIHAVLATEDRRFYSHIGIDPIGTGRAIAHDIRIRHLAQGGSTITQQLAKNLFLTPDRTFKRKVQEAMLALWLERLYTKDQILTAYLNRVYLGAGTYGVEAASQTYFDKSARDLDLRECAIIAGLLKAPTEFSPKSNPNEANQRAAVVLDNMVEAGYLSPEQREALGDPPPVPRRKPGEADSGRYFADWIADETSNILGGVDQDVIVKTTLDLNLQRLAEHTVSQHLADEGPKDDATQAALLSLDADGAILAMVGGDNWRDSQYNHVTQARRQPGSAFKPFIYLAALLDGMTPDTEVEDRPIHIGKWSPENFDGHFHGPMLLKDALANSINSVAIQLLQRVGPQRAIQIATDFGISSPLTPDLSLALGTSEVTMLELAGAYASINAEGQAVQPYGIIEIDTLDRHPLYRHKMQAGPQIVDQAAVRTLKDMMRGVVAFGTGKSAQLPGIDISAKTGTSADYRDAWFMGMVPGMMTGVWAGNDDDSSMKRVTGGGLPAHIWHDYMAAALAERPETASADAGRQRSDVAAQSESPPAQQHESGLGGFIQMITGSAPSVEYHYPQKE